MARKDFDTLLPEAVAEGLSSMGETKKITEEIVRCDQMMIER